MFNAEYSKIGQIRVMEGDEHKMGKLKYFRDNISIVFLLLFVLNSFISSNSFMIVSLIMFIFLFAYAIVKNINIYIDFKIIIPYILILLVGFVGNFGMANIERDLVRDLLVYMSPLIYLLFGLLYKQISNKVEPVYNSLIISSLIVCLYDLFNKALYFMNNGFVSFLDLRYDVGFVGVSVIISFALLMFNDKINISRFKRVVIMLVFLASILLSFSRTNYICLLVFIIILLLKNYKKNGMNAKIFITFAALISLFIFLISSNEFNDFIFKFEYSFSEMSLNHKWNSLEEIQKNWRGYEAYCAFNEFTNFSSFNKLFGGGFGKTIDVGNYGVMFGLSVSNTIPRIHNGVFEMLVKCGIVGCLIYAFVLLYYLKKSSGWLQIGIAILFIVLVYFSAGIFCIGGFFFECLVIYALEYKNNKSEGFKNV